MKSTIAIIPAVVFAIGLSTAFASNPQESGKQEMPTQPQAAQQTPVDPQNACNAKYPGFSQLDTKHKDYLTKKEASQVPGLEHSFKKIDTNHNGKLSQSEYTAWVQSQCRSNMSQQPQGQMTPPPV